MPRLGYADMAEFYARERSRLSSADVQSRRENLSLPEIRSTIPSGATYVLVDELQTRLASDDERRSVPFLEKDGKYWARPADNRQATTEIERFPKTRSTHTIFP